VRSLASPARNVVLVPMPALAAIEALGDRAVELRRFVGELRPDGLSPDPRSDGTMQ
jgi:hypothetical protein